MKISNLKPRFNTIDEDFNNQKTIYRRNKAFASWLAGNFPPNIEGVYSFDDMGHTCIRVFINLKPEDEDSAKGMITYLKWLKTKRFKIEKFWRKDAGYFAYKANREYGWKRGKVSVDYIIFFEHAANLDGCVVRKKRKMQTIYETDCEKERVEL